jgi:hypothetical protein
MLSCHMLPFVLSDVFVLLGAVLLPGAVATVLPGAVELVLPDTFVLLVLPGGVELMLPDTFVLLGFFLLPNVVALPGVFIFLDAVYFLVCYVNF